MTGKPGILYDTSAYLLLQPRLGTETHIYSIAAGNTISMQLMVPPPLCFPFRTAEDCGWFGIGLTAENGSYHFDGFSYRNMKGCAAFPWNYTGGAGGRRMALSRDSRMPWRGRMGSAPRLRRMALSKRMPSHGQNSRALVVWTSFLRLG